MRVPACNDRRGVVVWFTGLSGSGKTTLCRATELDLRMLGYRVCILDSDELRRTMNRDLGFNKADRDENVTRIASLARAMAEKRFIVLVAAISPYRDARARARESITSFIEVYVDAPLSLCMELDTKGLYAKAREGKIGQVSGVDAPYEVPLTPELHLATASDSVPFCVAKIRKAINDSCAQPELPCYRENRGA